ncbi:hypothetical protein CYMTET_19173, partial [Cymbomonas tetramitiformis]
ASPPYRRKLADVSRIAAFPGEGLAPGTATEPGAYRSREKRPNFSEALCLGHILICDGEGKGLAVIRVERLQWHRLREHHLVGLRGKGDLESVEASGRWEGCKAGGCKSLPAGVGEEHEVGGMEEDMEEDMGEVEDVGEPGRAPEQRATS